MPRLKPGDIPLSPEEDAVVVAAILSDPDDFELDADWFAGASPASEVLPFIFKNYGRSGQNRNSEYDDSHRGR